jgi:hypothetical protein
VTKIKLTADNILIGRHTHARDEVVEVGDALARRLVKAGHATPAGDPPADPSANPARAFTEGAPVETATNAVGNVENADSVKSPKKKA